MAYRKEVIITSPSLNPEENVSGVSEVARFIMRNNPRREYLHFCIGKKDGEGGGMLRRVRRVWKTYREWRRLLAAHPGALVHYSFPLDARSVVRDYFFIRHAYRQGRRMLVHIHGGLYLTRKSRPWLIDRLMRRVFSWDIPFVVLSAGERDTVRGEFGARRVEVLPNCVDPADAAPRSPKAGGKPLTIGYLGRIEANKGMDWLLLACERLLRAGVRFRLEMAGKEEAGTRYVEGFARLLGDSFRYHGVVAGAAKRDFLRSFDAFVLPSHFEGLPMSLLETMGYGAVPVVTPVGSIPGVVEDGRNGILVKVRDADSIAEAVARLSADRRLLRRLSEEARRTILDRFSPEAYVDRLNRLYDGL